MVKSIALCFPLAAAKTGFEDLLVRMTRLQDDLDGLENWAKTNRMNFNRDKCKVLHLGRRNQMHTSRVGDTASCKHCMQKGVLVGVLVGHT